MLQGVKEHLPEETKKRDEISEKIIAFLKKSSFSRITTPTFEPYEEVSKGWDEYLKKEAIRFVNSEGILMSLRPDMTSSIARLISSRQEELQLPLKLFYIDNIFRRNDILRKQEILQFGIEYIGAVGIESDVETIHILINLLKECGISNFKVEVGHVENIQNKTNAEIEALSSLHYHELKELPLIGDESVLVKDSFLDKLNNQIKNLYPNDQHHIQYNLSLVEKISYYTGIIFKIFIEDVGYIVGNGGRYDKLLELYNYSTPAIGFAIDFEKLFMGILNEK